MIAASQRKNDFSIRSSFEGVFNNNFATLQVTKINNCGCTKINRFSNYLFLTLKMQQLSNLREFQSLNLNWKFDQFSRYLTLITFIIIFTHFQTNKCKLQTCLNQIRKKNWITIFKYKSTLSGHSYLFFYSKSSSKHSLKSSHARIILPFTYTSYKCTVG